MPKLNWDGNDFRNSQDSSGTVAENISRNGNLQQGYKHGSLTKGLVAYYPMEKGQGEVLHDAALDNLAQINGATWNGAGKVGNNSLEFDGSNDFVECGIIPDYSKGVTFSLWIRRDGAADNYDRLIDAGDDTANGSVLHMLDGNTVRFRHFYGGSNEATIDSSTALSDQTWHHVVGTWTGDKRENGYRLYIDGNLEGATSTTVNGSEGAVNIILSKYVNGDSQYFSGSMDDVRIYHRALSQPEITALFNEGSGVQSGVQETEKDVPGQDQGGISRYKLNGTADDSWGSNDGTDNTSLGYTTGVFGQAKSFDGTDGVDLGMSDFNPVELSVSAWVYVKDNLSNRMGIVGNRVPGGDAGFRLIKNSSQYDNSAQLEIIDGDKQYVAAAGKALNSGRWYHLVGTLKGGATRIYVNGSISASGDKGGSGLSNTSNNVYIGTSGSENFDGYIDDVRIYDEALKPRQIEKLYHKGAYRIPRESTLQ